MRIDVQNSAQRALSSHPRLRLRLRRPALRRFGNPAAWRAWNALRRSVSKSYLPSRELGPQVQPVCAR